MAIRRFPVSLANFLAMASWVDPEYTSEVPSSVYRPRVSSENKFFAMVVGREMREKMSFNFLMSSDST